MSDDDLTIDAEHEAPPRRTDGPWTIGPEPARPRYMVLGEEGDETLVIHGHGIDEDTIDDVARHAGFGPILDWYAELKAELDDEPCDDRDDELTLAPVKTWARQVRGCPRHHWIPRWLRVGIDRIVGAADWLRWQVFRRLWHIHDRRDPLRERRVPSWARWLSRPWQLFQNCACVYVDHYHTCDGCGFCASDGTGTVPSWWDWSTKDGAPADANAGRPGYLPVTVIHIGG